MRSPVKLFIAGPNYLQLPIMNLFSNYFLIIFFNYDMMLSIWLGYGRRNKIKLPYRMQKVNRKKKLNTTLQ